MSDEQPKQGHTASPLRSLAPRYETEQHEAYLRRLQAALKQDSNRNIALTGAYGTGKSSILDEFCKREKAGTLRLSTSTLGAANDDAALTNRLQKEVVKQLLYSADPKILRNSRFKRIRSLSFWRASRQALGATAVLTLLLFMTDNLPPIVGTEDNRQFGIRLLAWLVTAAAVALVLTLARRVTFDRFVVSTLGGAVTLREDTSTYFDEYLDEIVHYFDSTKTRVVVFEDLDRFDDPQIFEALRELNGLLNNTDSRRRNAVPLRFIYAVKDSLFEQLGKEVSPRQADDESGAMIAAPPTRDAAAIEAERANRTKFFDLVIPVVPFISHRNAREHLAQVMDDAGIVGVERALIDLVARHTTDMRLLVNLCNEYVVFAERLLDSRRVAPDLMPSNLFALVAYKMFHMKDFERIARRRSRLDDLYAESRAIVTREVASRRKQLRDLQRGRTRVHVRAGRAKVAGTRLSAIGNAVDTTGARQQDWGIQSTLVYQIDDNDYDAEATQQVSFWTAAAEAGAIDVIERHANGRNRRILVSLSGEILGTLIPGVSEARTWDDIDEQALREETAELEATIARFRGAGFEELLDLSDDFGRALDSLLTSEMARELVRRGYLTRHFATYAAQFFGDFTGVDVVTFIMQTVERNTVDIEYDLSAEGAVANLLDEAGEGFTRSISALNINVLDHLLAEKDPHSEQIARQVIDGSTGPSRDFLAAYLSAGDDPEGLVALLATQGWAPLLRHVAADESVPDEARARLLDAALRAAAPVTEDALDDAVRELIADNHAAMSSFTTSEDPRVVQTVADVVTQLNWRVPDLAPMSASLRTRLIEAGRYKITASNLRIATGETEIALDALIGHALVYRHVLASPDVYLDTVDGDDGTEYAIERSKTLIRVLDDVVGDWDPPAVAALLHAVHPESRLKSIVEAPEPFWAVIVDADLIEVTLENVATLLRAGSRVDARLGGLLRRATGIVVDVESGVDTASTKAEVAVAVINAEEHIGNLDERISIVLTLAPVPPLPRVEIEATDGALLARLLEADLVPDSQDTFEALRPTSWEGMDAALRASTRVEDFVTAELLEGYVARVLASPTHQGRFGSIILSDLSSFVPQDDRDALARAAEFSIQEGTTLPLDDVRRIARATSDAHLTVRIMNGMHYSAPPTELASVLAELGQPYSRLVNGGSPFDVPFNDDFKAVFDRLRGGGLCERRKRKLRDRIQVTPTPSTT